jgi:hypothetical protein
MNSTGLLIGAAAVGLVGYSFLKEKKESATEFVTSIVVTPDEISINTNNLLAPKIDVVLRLENPTTVAISVNKLFGEVKLNGYSVGTLNNSETILVNPTSSTTITASFTINGIAVISNLLKIVQAGKFYANVKGYVTANNIDFPFEKEWSI